MVKVIAKATQVFEDNRPEVWQGYIECRKNNRLVWRQDIEIDRLTKQDAKADANRELDFIKSTTDLNDVKTTVWQHA